MVEYAWSCGGCGAACHRPTWAIVGSEDRPGILAAVAEGLVYVRCRSCGTATDIDLPVVVVRPRHPFEVLFAFPDSYIGREDEPPEYARLMGEVYAASGAVLSGWHLWIPRVLLPVALARDVEADIDDIEKACGELVELGPALVERYRTFLTLGANGKEERAVAEALHQLWSVEPDDLPEFLATHSELASLTAMRAVQAEFAAGPPPGESEEPLRNRLDLVQALHEGEAPHLAASRYLAAVGRFGAQLQAQLQTKLDQLSSIGPYDTNPAIVERLREALALARAMGMADLEIALSADLIGRLLTAGDPRLTDEAVQLGTRALSLGPDAEQRLILLTNLADAFVERPTGDRTKNWGDRVPASHGGGRIAGSLRRPQALGNRPHEPRVLA